MNVVPLSPVDLSLAALLVVLLALMSRSLKLGIAATLLIAASRATVQLLLLGLVLRTLFDGLHPAWMILMSIIMLGVAGYEVLARQQHRFRGTWGFGMGTLSMFVSSFSIALIALTTMIQVEPWYTPQYLIPLLGMLLGNTMNGIAISLDRLTHGVATQYREIEAQLALGHRWHHAITTLRRDSLRSGLIPIINAMTTAGIVSLPGMMTGQILGGSPPMEAAKYQILILFLIAAGSGFGSVTAVWLASRRLFDDRERLRLDRIGINP
ncbi:MAG TPA: iron export ABC transporter permease subunit FetB [Chromatiaceae bacterium]|jgi:putative ABC transport system permease protein|nr:iron export ABC transporter permease subunit FetB [Chromatiaceae bacterium]HIN83065.1 iron export ABC transporter permease subunit FetB [Chromatiales bacterium]HIA08412.1 iron export ABC transporter permease subunit FetB [Chromatiaceae bacterium]HIB84049.1 iron export ABC transporter permease subunit FetB [Chromatiaceae bacterium]HIO13750.1 iron export ABC transporter permease subunit FetB [Chromatiales bacterium]